MYELILKQDEYEKFIKKARCKMTRLEVSYKKLAEMTGYSLPSIYGFFHGKNSRFIAAAVARELKI